MGPTLRLRSALALLVFVSLGCSHRADAPLQTPTGPNLAQANQVAGVPLAGQLVEKEVGLVDLGPGRITRISGEWRIRELPEGGPPGAWETHPTELERTIQAEEETPVAGGPSYRVENELQRSESDTVTFAYLWRQDRSGLFLYQEDVEARAFRLASSSAVRPAVARALALIEQKRAAVLGVLSQDMPVRRATAAPGGPGPHEITFLLYPLHPNATWDGRPGFNVWTVEAKEWLDTLVGRFHAARLHIVVPGAFGPDDYALTWWAEPGEVKRHYHFLAPTTDENGQPIGMIELEETLELTRYEPGS